ncbi:MAG: glycosyltransferase family 1 protein [Chloroflexi bacterium]|nr:MAG: glycosyltransferase family 1 protein [Chloroflexota bacterium]
MTDSCFVRQTLVERFGFVAERVKVVPLGVEAGFRPFSADVVAALRAKYQLPPLPVLLHVGGVQKRKNFEGLIEAVANLHREGITAVLIHAGRPPTPRQQTQIEANGLSQFVHCLGYVTDEELVNLYNLADVFVFPSLYEGFGIPPLEAMACGTPVITSNAASLPEVVGDAGILVDATDVEALTDAIRRVLEDSTLAATLRAKGLARARQFTWERTAQETAAVYRAIWEAMA